MLKQGNFIHSFWESQATKHGDAPAASWGDNYAINLEVQNIAAHIKDGDSVLDVGCANGFAAIRQWNIHKLKSISGIDFSQEMITNARRAVEVLAAKDKFDFRVGDVKEIPFPDESFDVVYTTRCLINLPNWEDQKRGIDECLRVCKKGGTVIFSEAFYEPLVRLNALRALAGLAPLVEHDFNRYLKKERLEDYLENHDIHDQIDWFAGYDFSSVYYLGSRFIRELVTKIENYAGYSNPINEKFYQLEKEFSGGGFGIQQSYTVKKK